MSTYIALLKSNRHLTSQSSEADRLQVAFKNNKLLIAAALNAEEALQGDC